MRFNNLRYTFDVQRFVADLTKAMRDMGCRASDMGRDIGYSSGLYSRMKAGRQVPNGRVLVAMAAWAGLDLRAYCRECTDAPGSASVPRAIQRLEGDQLVQASGDAPAPAVGDVDRLETLTKCERDVLTLQSKGFTVKEVAGHLGIACSTVNSHLKKIHEKLEVGNRIEAAVIAAKAGLV